MSQPPEHFPKLPPGQRIYAVGDVHGRADLLEKMLRLIEADQLGYPGEATIITVGDYIDRGPASKGVLDLLTKYNGRAKLVPLRGNHEDIILNFFKDPATASGWFQYGGLQTLRSYGISVSHATQDFDDLYHLNRQLLEVMPKEHRHFLENLGYTAQYGDYLFVHAGIQPDLPLEKQTPHHFMWTREPFLSTNKHLGFVVVHGHSIRMTPEVRANRIGIDTGAYATGHLTAVVLQDGDKRFLST